MARPPWGSPAQKAALVKARTASARVRRSGSRRHYSSNVNKRGSGTSGLRKNFIPYIRVNKRSQTSGFNAGTVLPGTGKRLVLGGYVRLENTSRKGGIDKAISKAGMKAMPYGTKRGKVRTYLSNNVSVTNPAIRASVGKHQVRLGSSRGAGPTIILRRGKHPTPQKKSLAGIKRYDQRTRTVAKAKKRRAQRRT